MILLIITFIAGILTVLAPCVLPLLPIIVGGSLNSKKSDKARPYIIAVSLAVSVILFTLILKVSTYLINLSPTALNIFSGLLIIILGAVSIVPEIWERLVVNLRWEINSQKFLGAGQRNRNKYIAPLLIGLSLGPVFSSCSPTYAFILASVLPRSLVSGLVYLIDYTIALVLTLLVVSLIGKKILAKSGWAINTHSIFRRAIGALFLITGIIIISGNQIKIETWIANKLPFDETTIERSLLSAQHTQKVNKKNLPTSPQSVANPELFNINPVPAPEFQDLSGWINSNPLSISGLRGQVVLVDFWTYSCVNCNRALPYVQKWYQAYANHGLTVVGVHTPEFAFEHNPTNVQNFVRANKITYPVALDNNYSTWSAFDNNSWPADYLIDKNGYIRYIALGEGDYDKTEKAIQDLLGVNSNLQTPVSTVPITSGQTPETYFGLNRTSGYVGSPDLDNGIHLFVPIDIKSLNDNSWTLAGKWNIGTEYITSVSDQSSLIFNFSAKDVYLVADSPAGAKTINVSVANGDVGEFGADNTNSSLTVNGARLYHIVSLPNFRNSKVRIVVPSGVSLYTFNFGS